MGRWSGRAVYTAGMVGEKGVFSIYHWGIGSMRYLGLYVRRKCVVVLCSEGPRWFIPSLKGLPASPIPAPTRGSLPNPVVFLVACVAAGVHGSPRASGPTLAMVLPGQGDRYAPFVPM